MITTSQFLLRDLRNHVAVEDDDSSNWKWLFVSLSAISAFAALLFGAVGVSVALFAVFVILIALDQRH